MSEVGGGGGGGGGGRWNFEKRKQPNEGTKEGRKNGKGDFVVLCSIVAHSGRATLRPAAGPEREREREMGWQWHRPAGGREAEKEGRRKKRACACMRKLMAVNSDRTKLGTWTEHGGRGWMDASWLVDYMLQRKTSVKLNLLNSTLLIPQTWTE